VVCGYYAGAYQRESASGSIYASRNFYGTLKITDREYPGGIEPVRRLIHGVILHGLQDLNLDYRHEATTYYGESSGVGIAIRHYANAQPNGIRVGVIGLGVGTLARYGRRGDYYRMYEINPTVIDVAQSYFSYIKDSQATVSFAQGDARLVLEREPEQQFDLLVIDAFSSDSIPIHLMTREALSVYRRHPTDISILRPWCNSLRTRQGCQRPWSLMTLSSILGARWRYLTGCWSRTILGCWRTPRWS
jgi:hypothetical protein